MYIFFYDRLFYFLDSIATIDIELENDSRKRDLTTSQQKVDVEMAASTYSCRYIYICRETSIVMDMGSTGFGFSRERENDPVFPIRTWNQYHRY